MKPSWRGNSAKKFLKKKLRPDTSGPESLIYTDGFVINGYFVQYYLIDDQLLIGLSHEEEDVGESFFSIEEAKDG